MKPIKIKKYFLIIVGAGLMAGATSCKSAQSVTTIKNPENYVQQRTNVTLSVYNEIDRTRTR